MEGGKSGDTAGITDIKMQIPELQPLAAPPVANKWFLSIGGGSAGNWHCWKDEGCVIGRDVVGQDWFHWFNEIGEGGIFQAAASLSQLGLSCSLSPSPQECDPRQ